MGVHSLRTRLTGSDKRFKNSPDPTAIDISLSWIELKVQGLGYCQASKAQSGEVVRQRSGSNHGPSGPDSLRCGFTGIITPEQEQSRSNESGVTTNKKIGFQDRNPRTYAQAYVRNTSRLIGPLSISRTTVASSLTLCFVPYGATRDRSAPLVFQSRKGLAFLKKDEFCQDAPRHGKSTCAESDAFSRSPSVRHVRKAGALAEPTKHGLATYDQRSGPGGVHDRNTAIDCTERTPNKQELLVPNGDCNHGIAPRNLRFYLESVSSEGVVNPQRNGSSGWNANLLTGRAMVRTRPSSVDFPCLGLSNLAVSQPSCFLRVAWQLGTDRVLQLNDYYIIYLGYDLDLKPKKDETVALIGLTQEKIVQL
ncbi:hypothetical protein T265_10193 [Opisthorchis viverrini]|uniref:Uncharacterized protein n=1 Tax=Opisthorchis viverrini TaxID=6198 RepID=A0A074ZE74_OPIVI|nr:hypothetical protein T265_10193 [Opisthorchis viverrini]KER21505.1 hypothetical protein T265_10193 [Opisthorchis viverrini]